MKAPTHPAKFTDSIMEELPSILRALAIGSEDIILDPFAGTGRIHQLRDHGYKTIGIEIEPEWAAMSPFTFVGDATFLPSSWDKCIAVWCSSPTYGNRMCDHHDAKDGSKRLTYKHCLGRDLHPMNTGQMPFKSESYKVLHRRAYIEAYRVIRDKNGFLIVNLKNFYEKGNLIDIVSWHRGAIERAGFHHVMTRKVETPGMRFGANRQRVDHEVIMVFKKKPFTPSERTTI